MGVIIGNCLDVLPTLEAGSVQTCVTSPPYFGLRDYGTEPQLWDCDPACDHDWNEFLRDGMSGGPSDKQDSNAGSKVKQQQQQCKKCAGWRGSFGQEPTPEMFVAHCVQIFREVRRVLKDDGTLWVNMGDSYSSGARTSTTVQTLRGQVLDNKRRGKNGDVDAMTRATAVRPPVIEGIKPKDLVGIPWILAFALRADGWYLRQDIIWHKPNPMPESVTDRCTKSHEYIFLLSKSEKYYFDAKAIAEPGVGTEYDKTMRPAGRMAGARYITEGKGQTAVGDTLGNGSETRNKRDVWTVTTKSFTGAHFATFPPDLIEPCILAGAPVGGMVLDPFGGSGTTGQVAEKLGRQWTLIELNPEYGKLINQRTAQCGIQFA